MLFDEKVVDLVNEHFIPVITDHPRGGTDPKRNPETWERCEGWKRYPNSAEIVWLVSADESRRAGLVYNPIKQPSQLLEWMEAVLVLDGEIAKPTPAQVHRAALVRMRSALGALWSWRGEKIEQEFHDQRRVFDPVIMAVTDDELCSAAEATDMLARLREPSAERTATRRTTLGDLIAAAKALGLGDAVWFSRFAGWYDADRIGGEAEYEAAVRMFRSWLRREIESGDARPAPELADELERLGVRVAGHEDRR